MKRDSLLVSLVTLFMVLGSTFFNIPILAEGLDISLYYNHSSDNSSFDVPNMFPGDSVSNTYNVKVSYHDKVRLIFNVDYLDQYATLAEVMHIKLSLNNNVLYDGLLKDFNDVSYTLYSDNNKTEVLKYDVTMSLDTSVDNDYQHEKLKLDFIWSIDKDDSSNLINTGYSSNIILWISLIILSLIMFIYLYRRNNSNVR